MEHIYYRSTKLSDILTLVMLNKLRCDTHFYLSANQIPVQIQMRSQLIWIYTVCKGRVYPVSAGQGLKLALFLCTLCQLLWQIYHLYFSVLKLPSLTLSTLDKIFSRQHFEIFFFFIFFPENRIWHFKCQILFSGKNMKNIVNLSSAENAQGVVKVKDMLTGDLNQPVYLYSLTSHHI